MYKARISSIQGMDHQTYQCHLHCLFDSISIVESQTQVHWTNLLYRMRCQYWRQNFPCWFQTKLWFTEICHICSQQNVCLKICDKPLLWDIIYELVGNTYVTLSSNTRRSLNNTINLFNLFRKIFLDLYIFSLYLFSGKILSVYIQLRNLVLLTIEVGANPHKTRWS